MIHATEAKQLSRAASSLLFTGLDFATKPNGQYPSEDFKKVLARSAFDGEFVHTTAKELQLAREEDIDLQQRSPLAKSLLYHLRGLSPDAIDAQFDGVRAATFAHARRQRAFTRPVDVALDIHEWLYYGSAETPHVCAINPDRGTNLAYAFVTLCVVDPAVRLTLAWESIEADDSRTLRESIRRLITTARQFVQLNRVYCDRSFYRVPLVEMLAELDVEFVVRAPKTPGVKRGVISVTSEHLEGMSRSSHWRSSAGDLVGETSR